MRVLIVSSLWPPRVLGGAELYAAELASELRGLGHEVGVLTLGVEADGVVASVRPWPYSMEEFASQGPLRRWLFHLLDVWNPQTGPVVDRAIAEFVPDVVHSHGVQGMSALALARPSRDGVPHVHTLHDYWLLCQRDSMVRRNGTACEERCSSCRAISLARAAQLRRHAPAIVLAVSAAIAREHRGIRWLSSRLRVVHNPVRVAHRPRPHPPGAGRPLRFVYLGRLAPYKGVRTLLDAWASATLTDAQLVVAGRGPMEEEVRRAGQGVEYAGWVAGPAKDELLDRADCIMVPSEWKDPAPLVVNEARARGIPVIGSRIGGIPELVAPQWERLLTPPGDARALAERMRAYAADPTGVQAPPAAAPIDWPGHIAEVVRAYTDAGAPTGPGASGQVR